MRLHTLFTTSLLIILFLALLVGSSARAQTDTWSPGTNITSGAMDAVAPDIVIDSQGVSHVVYVQTDFESVGDVLYQHNRGGEWSPPIPLSSGIRSEVGGGQRTTTISTVTVSNTVMVAVAYQGRESSGRRRIWYRESFDGGLTWSSEEEVTSHSGIQPALKLDENRRPHLAYIRSDNDQLLAYYTTRDRNGRWQARDIGKSVDRNPDITFTYDANGDRWLQIAYQSQPGQNAAQDELQVVSMRRSPDGTWSLPEERQRDTAQYPSLASNGASTVYAVWSARGGGYDIEPSFSFSPNHGGIWDTPQFMGTLTSDLGQRPDIARSPATGALAVVWEDDYDTTPFVYDIYGRMSFDGGETWSALQTVYRAPGGSGTAAIGANPTGGFRAVWDDGFFGTLTIFTSGYNDPGPSTLPPTPTTAPVTPTAAPTVTPTPEPATPQLAVNVASGAPGSYFTITGSNFPAVLTGTLTINGVPLGNITIGDDGSFAFLISTPATAQPGIYTVRVTAEGESASASFTLDATAPLQSRDDSITSDPIPLPVTTTPLQPVSYLPLILYTAVPQ